MQQRAAIPEFDHMPGLFTCSQLAKPARVNAFNVTILRVDNSDFNFLSIAPSSFKFKFRPDRFLFESHQFLDQFYQVLYRRIQIPYVKPFVFALLRATRRKLVPDVYGAKRQWCQMSMMPVTRHIRSGFLLWFPLPPRQALSRTEPYYYVALTLSFRLIVLLTPRL